MTYRLDPSELERRLAMNPDSSGHDWIHRMAPDIFPEGGPSGDTTPQIVLNPSDPTQTSRNPLRPFTLNEMIGQEKLKPLLRRLIDRAKSARRPLDPLLLVGAAGTGKTTTATVVAHELGTRVFELKAPLTTDVLMALRSSAQDCDVVFVDEIHLQVSGDRRGLTQAADPEAFYRLLEDGTLSTPTGPLDFPRVTWIGATTDVGLLPIPLSDRFTLQPRLSPYTKEEMAEIAVVNARALDLAPAEGVALMFAVASRGIPRQVNQYMRAAQMLAGIALPATISVELAREVIEDLFSTTLDGLTESMQVVLRFLYSHCRRDTKNGTIYTASVNTLATAAGHGRDTKAINLLVEPYLLQHGLLEVRPTGRTLTYAGVERARQLI